MTPRELIEEIKRNAKSGLPMRVEVDWLRLIDTWVRELEECESYPLTAEVRRLRMENAELQRDAERLDWILDALMQEGTRWPNTRSEIDAAMARELEKPQP